MSRDEHFMRLAMQEAEKAAAAGDVPVGAVIVKNGEIIARGHNTREQRGDVLGHAELEAIRSACAVLGDWRLTGCTLYVTLEPCPMCTGAIINARIDENGRVVTEGDKILIGGNDSYVAMCHSCWQAEIKKQKNK